MITFDRRMLIAFAIALVGGPLAAAEPPHHVFPRRIVVHPRPARPAAASLVVGVAPGVTFATPFTVVAGEPGRVVRVPHYIGPDGTYNERSDIIRSVNGTPCGQECTRLSLRRWGYEPVE